jgi:hypothetical protein
MTTGIATVTETATGTGIVIEIAGGATRETIGETIEETIDVMTEETCAMIGVEMIVDVHVPATDGIANPRPRPPEIPPRSPSQLPRSRTKSSRQREQD